MHAAFHIPRDNHIKLFAPLIDFLLQRGEKVSILCDYCLTEKQLGIKAYQFPAVEKIPQFRDKPDIYSFKSAEELAEIVKKNCIDVMFFVNFPPIEKELKLLLGRDKYPILIAELQHYYDMMLLKKDVLPADVIYFYSDSWLHWWRKYIAEHKQIADSQIGDFFEKLESKKSVVGFPELDQAAGLDREKICRKYNLPTDKKIVLLMPFPAFSSLWIDAVYKHQPKILKRVKLFLRGATEYLPDIERGIDDFAVVKAIRKFCDKNDGFFVAKGRLKNPVPKYVEKMADRLFFDKGFYPFFSLELLAISSIMLSFCSMAVLESVALNVPSVCIIPHKNKLWQPYEILGLPDDFKTVSGSIYNMPGAVELKTAEEVIFDFPNENFERYKIIPQARKNYVEKFLGFDDFSASARIYEDLHRRLKGVL